MSSNVSLLISSGAAPGNTVFDTSAVLALLFNEPGANTAQLHLPNSVISAANLAEALSKLSDKGLPDAKSYEAVEALGLSVVSLTLAQAMQSAALRQATRSIGLSLGDRVCLALAREFGLPVVTADRAWQRVASVIGVTVHLIR